MFCSVQLIENSFINYLNFWRIKFVPTWAGHSKKSIVTPLMASKIPWSEVMVSQLETQFFSLTATQGIDVTVGRLTLLPDWTTLNVLVDLFSPSFWISRAASVLWDWPVYKKCDLKVWIRPLSLESVWSMLWISSVLSIRNLLTNFVGFTNVFSHYLSQVISKQELRGWGLRTTKLFVLVIEIWSNLFPSAEIREWRIKAT